MTLEDKIGRVRELLAQRDQIDSELEGLIGDAPAASQAREKRPEARSTGKGKKGARHCSKCGETGHIARNCNGPTGKPSRTVNDDNQNKLDEDQFDALKHLQSIGDLISKDFAHDHDLPLAQVNRAIASRNYEEYIGF